MTVRCLRAAALGARGCTALTRKRSAQALSFGAGLARCCWAPLPLDVFAQQCERGTVSRHGEVRRPEALAHAVPVHSAGELGAQPSRCGHRDGPKPLKVRSWTCPACGVSHDRDLNAARKILVEGQRLVAAGRKGAAAMPCQAETVNACGADIRPGPARVVGCEAGTHRGAV
ncbi:zinc ribbon domain-containing protein [Frankia gtarii]|uniref:zinc ribbon domain-containing protein n=1 Tax=Frankia gtarii TaxID=2950102 RepID=UPI003F682E43